ncbi:hypothetical protein BDY19DRAFT_520683 [Irpex rosettiformis]|uniref:Uncharacterized protein n=1 Tax=Irpex rosettiformis TaxID=378272 RepID=A0ACB8TRH0_9APHY|nr:hypothetical protein BDY19DRAFT_520683 [Irpex rosettiformis]
MSIDPAVSEFASLMDNAFEVNGHGFATDKDTAPGSYSQDTIVLPHSVNDNHANTNTSAIDSNNPVPAAQVGNSNATLADSDKQPDSNFTQADLTFFHTGESILEELGIGEENVLLEDENKQDLEGSGVLGDVMLSLGMGFGTSFWKDVRKIGADDQPTTTQCSVSPVVAPLATPHTVSPDLRAPSIVITPPVEDAPAAVLTPAQDAPAFIPTPSEPIVKALTATTAPTLVQSASTLTPFIARPPAPAFRNVNNNNAVPVLMQALGGREWLPPSKLPVTEKIPPWRLPLPIMQPAETQSIFPTASELHQAVSTGYIPPFPLQCSSQGAPFPPSLSKLSTDLMSTQVLRLYGLENPLSSPTRSNRALYPDQQPKKSTHISTAAVPKPIKRTVNGLSARQAPRAPPFRQTPRPLHPPPPLFPAHLEKIINPDGQLRGGKRLDPHTLLSHVPKEARTMEKLLIASIKHRGLNRDLYDLVEYPICDDAQKVICVVCSTMGKKREIKRNQSSRPQHRKANCHAKGWEWVLWLEEWSLQSAAKDLAPRMMALKTEDEDKGKARATSADVTSWLPPPPQEIPLPDDHDHGIVTSDSFVHDARSSAANDSQLDFSFVATKPTPPNVGNKRAPADLSQQTIPEACIFVFDGYGTTEPTPQKPRVRRPNTCKKSSTAVRNGASRLPKQTISNTPSSSPQVACDSDTILARMGDQLSAPSPSPSRYISLDSTREQPHGDEYNHHGQYSMATNIQPLDYSSFGAVAPLDVSGQGTVDAQLEQNIAGPGINGGHQPVPSYGQPYPMNVDLSMDLLRQPPFTQPQQLPEISQQDYQQQPDLLDIPSHVPGPNQYQGGLLPNDPNTPSLFQPQPFATNDAFDDASQFYGFLGLDQFPY